MSTQSEKGSILRTVQQTVQALAIVLIFASAFVLQARGQSESGGVVGTVTDQTGAVVPQATLTLTNLANGLVLTTKANSAGELNLPAVPRGDYSAKIAADGFEAQTQMITITVTQTQTLLFKLSPGAVTSSVTVTSAAALVNTTSATLGETMESKQIEQLPLNGRNSLNLALLTPGVTQGAYTEYGQDTVNRFSDSGGGAISVNGTRAQANNFIMDGVDNNDGLQNVIMFFPPRGCHGRIQGRDKHCSGSIWARRWGGGSQLHQVRLQPDPRLRV